MARGDRKNEIILTVLLVVFGLASPSGTLAQPVLVSEAEPRFRFPVEGRVVSGPVVSGGRVWFVTDARLLFVVTEDGKAVARSPWPQAKDVDIVCDGFGRALVSSGSDEYSLVNRAGQVITRIRLNAVPDDLPVFGADGRFFIAGGGTLRAFSASGHPIWSKDSGKGDAVRLAPVPGGGVLTGSSSGMVRAYSPYGKLLLERKAPDAIIAMASSPGSGIAVSCANGSVLIWSAIAEGTEPALVRFPFVAQKIAGAPGLWIALDASGTLAAMDASGAHAWDMQTAVRGEADLLAFDERVVVLSRGLVASFDLTGKPFRTLSIKNSGGVPSFSSAGTVYSGGLDWILYAYAFERTLTSGNPVPGAPQSDEAFRDAVREEVFWTPDGSSDDAILKVLGDIEKTLKSGSIGMDEERAIAYCCGIALGFGDAPFGIGAVPPGPNPKGPLPRERACDILGTLGSPAATEPLSRVFSGDRDQAVRAAAAAAIAQIGLDPDGIAFAAFAESAKRSLDGRTAIAVARAIERLYRANGTLDDGTGLVALMRIASGPYPYSVKKEAEAALGRVTAKK